MAYPNIDISTRSSVNLQRNLLTDTSDDGTVWGRDLSVNTLYRFSVVHEHITAAEKDELLDFYDNNTNATFTFTLDDVAYMCRFVTNNALRIEIFTGKRYTVSTELIGTKA